MAERLTYEQMIESFSTTRCKPNFDREWFIKNYTSSQTVIPIICHCGNPFQLKCSSFRLKTKYEKQCKACMNIEKSEKNRWTYESVVSLIRKVKCKPLFNKKWFKENYKDLNKTILKIQCKCGNEINKCIATFKKFPNCEDCGRLNWINSVRLTYEDILSIVNKTNCKLQTDKETFNESYIGVEVSKFNFICKCGEPFDATIGAFRNGKQKCKSCSTKGNRAQLFTKDVLDKFNIKYRFKHTFEDLKSVKFDFVIFKGAMDKEKEPLFIIELNGPNHFKPVNDERISMEKAVERYENKRLTDSVKNRYCKENNIPILRLAYKKKFNESTIHLINEKVTEELIKYDLIQG